MLKREAVEFKVNDEPCYVSELMAGSALDVVMDADNKRPLGLRLLAASLVRENGGRVFASVDDAAALIPFPEYLRLYPIAQRLNGLDGQSAGEA
jgi:hypothetical protein